MKYVVDSSVAFKWTVPEADSDKARRLRSDYEQGIDELVAPDVFPFEIAHALTRAERQGRVTQGQALALWLDIMSTSPRLVPSLPLAQRAIELSSQHRVGVYDCLYVALAERDGAELVTADVKLVKNLQSTFAWIVSLSSLP